MIAGRIHRRLGIEELEPRIALSDIHAGAAAFTFGDAMGIQVSVKLTGNTAGWGTVTRDPVTGDMTGIELFATNNTALLTITTTRPKTVDAATPNETIILGDLIVHGSLKSISAKSTSVDGDIFVTGSLGTVTLNDFANGALTIGDSTGSVTLTFDDIGGLGEGTSGIVVGDASIRSACPIKALTVAGGWWGELSSGTEGEGLAVLQAPSIGAINIKDGDFAPDVTATTGGITSIMVKGGDVYGALSAGKAIGNITVTGVALWDKDTLTGDFWGGKILSPEINAGADKGKSIGVISLTGGGLGVPDGDLVITATGDIGSITTKSFKYKVYSDLDFGTAYSYAYGGIYANINASGKIGALTTSGGDVDGEMTAGLGFGNITVSGILTGTEEGGIEAGLFAGLYTPKAIGVINVKGGDMDATLSAGTGIGSITVQVMTCNAKVVPDGLGGKTSVPGYFMGQSLSAHIYLGDTAGTGTLNNPAAKIGTISGKGVDVTLDGKVPDLAKVKVLTPTRVTYIADYVSNDPENPNKLDPEKGTCGNGLLSTSGLGLWGT